ncbi:S4 domain-containing protein [Cohnella yongneupensis]|uniref:S4 domain-containing protein n=1 Tax=Cohnella yongneupensis TaxID=425006 RepID=A0ABW0QTS9_9BACL
MSKLLVTLGFASSNSEARRSVTQGAVKINETKLLDPNDRVQIQSGDIVQAGKRKFAKIVVG